MAPRVRLGSSWSLPPNLRCAHPVSGNSIEYKSVNRNGVDTSHPNMACPSAENTSPEPRPVTACQSASFDRVKALACIIFSPPRKKGTIKLICNGVARKLESIMTGGLHLAPRIAAAIPQNTTVTPQMGNTPKVMPRAAENASCVGSAPLRNCTMSGL